MAQPHLEKLACKLMDAFSSILGVEYNYISRQRFGKIVEHVQRNGIPNFVTSGLLATLTLIPRPLKPNQLIYRHRYIKLPKFGKLQWSSLQAMLLTNFSVTTGRIEALTDGQAENRIGHGGRGMITI